MRFISATAKVLLLALAFQAIAAMPVLAQGAKKPVMENVFFNVVWGSALGGILGIAAAVIQSSDHSAPEDARSSAFTGATAGGLAGLGVGLYLVFQGITFEKQGATILGKNGSPALNPADFESPAFTLVSAPDNPSRIIGFQARVLNIKF